MKMERKNTWILYVSNLFRSYCNAVLYLLVWSVSTETCPDPCTYFEDSANVTCLDSQEIDLPLVVPQWTNTLILRGTNISALPESAFLLNGTDLEFKTLQLSWNNIQVIEGYAFRGLSRLQRLDLSHNTLTTVSARAFCGLEDLRVLYLNNTLMSSGAWELPMALSTGCLRNLQRLDLSGNRLKAIPIARFDNLNLNTLVLTNNSIETIGINNISSFKEYKKIRIYLSLNPFKCNCELQAFYYWLKNDSQCADSSRLLCALPETKRGLPVEKLLKEDIDCINAELETVSYVFLGIVLALIGVVFLMVLYLNRGGIKRWLNNIRDACRDQMEVYHYRYEQDSDPRLENVAV